MFPMWFFIVLIVLICYLLYATRTTEKDLETLSKSHQANRLQYLAKESGSES